MYVCPSCMQCYLHSFKVRGFCLTWCFVLCACAFSVGHAISTAGMYRLLATLADSWYAHARTLTWQGDRAAYPPVNTHAHIWILTCLMPECMCLSVWVWVWVRLCEHSRAADGRKVLRSSVREFLCSEAMYHLVSVCVCVCVLRSLGHRVW